MEFRRVYNLFWKIGNLKKFRVFLIFWMLLLAISAKTDVLNTLKMRIQELLLPNMRIKALYEIKKKIGIYLTIASIDTYFIPIKESFFVTQRERHPCFTIN